MLAQQSTNGKGGEGPEGTPWWMCIIFAVALLVIWYFVFIRPKQKEQEEREEMLEAIEPNDKIVTIGGIRGKVTNIGEDLITVKIDENKNVKVKCKRWSIRDNLTKQEEEEDGAGDGNGTEADENESS